MSREGDSRPKWTCEYCTYANYPSALKCTMCRGAKPLLGEDIYRLREGAGAKHLEDDQPPVGWSCRTCTLANGADSNDCVGCGSSRKSPPLTSVADLHAHLKPLRISDPPPPVSSPTHAVSAPPISTPDQQFKWACSVCTYENWPRARKCTMCSSPGPPTSPPRIVDDNSTYNTSKCIEEDMPSCSWKVDRLRANGEDDKVISPEEIPTSSKSAGSEENSDN